MKGILKYPFDWTPQQPQDSDSKGRLFHSGPSSLDSDDQGYFGTSCESPDSVKYLVQLDHSVHHVTEKKHVTWSEKDVIFVFRKGSSILGCRKKNQKKAKRKREKARERDDETLTDDGQDGDINAVREMIANQRFSVCEVDDFDSVSDASSSGCDCSTSEASGDEEVISVKVDMDNYTDEKKFEGNSNKQKRKKQRKRNRKSKQNLRNRLETGYDSD